MKKSKRLIAILMSVSVMVSMVLAEPILVLAEEVEEPVQTEEIIDTEQTDDEEQSVTDEEIEFYEDVAAEVLEGEDAAEAVDEKATEGPEEDYDTPTRKVVSSIASTSWVLNKVNIRAKAKQTATDFNTLQGSCTDGSAYAYFAFMNKNSGKYLNKIKVIKIRLSDCSYVCQSAVLENEHGNGMTYVRDYDGSGNDAVAIANKMDGYKKKLTMLDPETLAFQTDLNLNYVTFLKNHPDSCEFYKTNSEGKTSLCSASDRQKYIDAINKYQHGYSSVAFDSESKRYALILNSSTDDTCHDIVVLKTEGKSIVSMRYIHQKRTEATIQSIDCDRDFIYIAWSPKDKVSSNNFIEVYDWKGNYQKKLTIGPSYEIESLFHTGSGDSATFYAAYHYGHTVTYQVKQKYKVKWKKVKKKVKWKKVKWKKVKKKVKWKKVRNKKGKLVWKYKYKKKWKYKWKYKKKKVWKYKTKTKTVTKSEINREGYLLNIGNLTSSI